MATCAILGADDEDDLKRLVENPAATLAARKKEIGKHITQKTGRPIAGTSVPKGSPWVWAIETYEAVPKQEPKILYGWVGEHLAVADKRYLGSDKTEERRKGLGLACEACNCAAHRLKDPNLAVQICEVYIVPNLDAADIRHWKYLGKQNVLEVIVGAYAEAKDADKMADALRLCIDNAHNRNTADAARLRLAQVLMKQEKYAEALEHLNEIHPDEGVGGGRSLIPEVEKMLKAKP